MQGDDLAHGSMPDHRGGVADFKLSASPYTDALAEDEENSVIV